MKDAAIGLAALAFGVALILGAAFAIPFLIHLLIELPQMGWRAAS